MCVCMFVIFAKKQKIIILTILHLLRFSSSLLSAAAAAFQPRRRHPIAPSSSLYLKKKKSFYVFLPCSILYNKAHTYSFIRKRDSQTRLTIFFTRENRFDEQYLLEKKIEKSGEDRRIERRGVLAEDYR